MTLTWSELCLEYPQLPTQVRGEWVREKTERWAGWANRAGAPGPGQTPEGHVITVEMVGGRRGRG